MVKAFWLSFVGDTGRSLGVCVIDVSEAEATITKQRIDVEFPDHLPGAEWLAAAQRKAWIMGCNPGGQVAAWELPISFQARHDVPRNRLMDKHELTRLDLI